MKFIPDRDEVKLSTLKRGDLFLQNGRAYKYMYTDTRTITCLNIKTGHIVLTQQHTTAQKLKRDINDYRLFEELKIGSAFRFMPEHKVYIKTEVTEAICISLTISAPIEVSPLEHVWEVDIDIDTENSLSAIGALKNRE